MAATEPSDGNRMLGGGKTRQTERRHDILVSRCRRGGVVFRLDRQHDQKNTRRHDPAKTIAPKEQRQLDGTEQSEVPTSGAARPDDGCGKGGIAGDVGERFYDRPRHSEGTASRPAPVGQLLPSAGTLQNNPHRPNPVLKGPMSPAVQEPAGQVPAKHAARHPLRRLERSRKAGIIPEIPPTDGHPSRRPLPVSPGETPPTSCRRSSRCPTTDAHSALRRRSNRPHAPAGEGGRIRRIPTVVACRAWPVRSFPSSCEYRRTVCP